jgi:hypothetical protein
MRWSIFVRRLTEMASWRAPTEDEVHAALLAAADDEDEREWFETGEAPREFLREHDHEADVLPLISFVWQPYMPLSSSLSVEWIAAEGRGLLVERNDYDSETDFTILACLPEQLHAIDTAALLRHLNSFRDHLRGCPAEEATNYAPTVVPCSLVRDLFGAFDIRVDDADQVRELVDRLADLTARARVQRWLPMNVSVSGALERLQALTSSREHALTVDDSRLLADLYFALAYVEASSR